MNSYQVNRAKWQAMTIFQQMGNIGAEVGRAIKAKKENNNENMQGAFMRGLDLFDATAEAWVGRSPSRVREILRARSQFSESILTNKTNPALEAYFMEFAIEARVRQLA